MPKENWTDIHEELKQDWLQNHWKKRGFSYSETKLWIEKGLTPQKYEFAYYLKKDSYQPSDLNQENLEQLWKKCSWKDVYKYFTFWDREKWEELGFTYEQFKLWINEFNFCWMEDVESWKKMGFTFEEIKQLVAVGFHSSGYWKARNWKELNFTLIQMLEWINIGLKVDEHEFAHNLRQKNYEPKSISIQKIIQKETWRDIHLDFNYQLRKKWEDKGFDKKQTQQWINIGLKPSDYSLCWWLKNVVEEVPKNILNYSQEKDLREQHEEYLFNQGLGKEVIEKIKGFDCHNLNCEQRALVDELILSEELKKKYKNHGLCRECSRINTEILWCQFCSVQSNQKNFKNWTSSNPKIDRFIQENQLKATDSQQILKWIPYEQFTNIKHLANGGFSKIYYADWKEHRSYVIGIPTVALKVLNNSQNMSIDFLQEVAYYKSIGRSVANCYGLSQDPKTKEYIIVMEYYIQGDLRSKLKFIESENLYSGWREFEERLGWLKDIAHGINSIHREKLVHKDLHPGNVIMSGYEYLITDLGLCQPADEKDKGDIYGVLPYVAPEVLRGESYTQASDIYSFGIIAYEIFSGLPLYRGKGHDLQLALEICEGLRPEFKITIPQLLKDLIKRCWDANPNQRPTADEINNSLQNWHSEMENNRKNLYFEKKDTEFTKQFQEAKKFSENLPKRNEEAFSINYTERYISELLPTKEISKYYELKESKTLEDCAIISKVQETINDSQLDNQNWQNIHSKFNEELIQKWQDLGFTSQQCKEWVDISSPRQQFQEIQEPEFYAWLRDEVKITAEEILNDHNLDFEALKFEFHQFQFQTLQIQPIYDNK